MNKSPDAFRSLAGAANMSGTEIVSVELGADFGALYQITWQHLIAVSYTHLFCKPCVKRP